MILPWSWISVFFRFLNWSRYGLTLTPRTSCIAANCWNEDDCITMRRMLAALRCTSPNRISKVLLYSPRNSTV